MPDLQPHLERIEQLETEVNRCRKVEEQVSRITNDLNNIFAAMKGQAQLACDDPSGAEREELVRVVLSGTLNAESVLSTLRPRATVASLDSDDAPGPALTTGNPDIAHVLVVDDEELMRRLLGRILEDSGCRVTLASNGREAIEIGGNRSFDLAFIDLHLGDMNGVEVFKVFSREQPDTHCIFVSGDPTLEQVASSVGRKATSYIKKPFDIDEVKQRISYILTMRAALLNRCAS